MKQLMFGDLEGFLSANRDIAAPATTGKLIEMLSDVSKRCALQLELAAIVDAGESLVKATYTLEGDGPIVLTAYELINTILLSIRTAHFPNLTSLADQMSALSANDSSAQQQLVTYG